MKIDTALMKAMAKAGVTTEQVVLIAEEYDALTAESRAERREQSRIRQQNHRERNSASRVTECDTPSLDKEKSPTPPKEIKPTPLPPVVSAREQFAEFWKLFPNKVGKRDAEREFGLALQRSSFDEIMAGLRRYVGKLDDRPWCNPSTFLHQNRWEDQPAATPQRRSTAPPPGKRMNAVEAYLSLEAERENEQTSGTIDHRDDERFPPDQPGLPRPAGDVGQIVEWPIRQRDYQRR